MVKTFTLDYWIDDGWYIGKLCELPGIFSQRETFEELKLNIQDAFILMSQEGPSISGQNFAITPRRADAFKSPITKGTTRNMKWTS